MRSILVALSLTASVLVGSTSPAFAESSKVARGTVTSIGGSSLTVMVGGQDMRFSVDGKTLVEVRGGSTKAGRAAASGAAGPHLAELIKAGQPVAVTYTGAPGSLHATTIKAVPQVASTAPADATLRSEGVVKAMGSDWITISGKGGSGSTFEQTFKIDSATKVYAKGAGTATAARGGSMPFADLVTSGDHVTVSYRTQGNSLLASDVHVTIKATH
jgi:Domain of unknown function (DUF5666)